MTSYLRQKFQSLTTGSSGSEDAKEEDPKSESKEEIEQRKIGIMKALVQKEEPSAKDADDLMIRRFLRARDLDVDKASAMFLKYLKWRKDFVPNGFISPSEIPNDIAHNKLFMQGYDKTGRPITVVFAARHKPTTVEEFKRYVTFTLEKICERMPSGHEKFVSIADVEGWGYANSDIRGYLAALSILQDCYPERLGKLFMVNVPYVFMTAWKMVYPFVDKNTKKKIVFVEKNKRKYTEIDVIYDDQLQIVFVEKNKTKETLLEDIDESQLPNTYGGALKLVPIHEC